MSIIDRRLFAKRISQTSFRIPTNFLLTNRIDKRIINKSENIKSKTRINISRIYKQMYRRSNNNHVLQTNNVTAQSHHLTTEEFLHRMKINNEKTIIGFGISSKKRTTRYLNDKIRDFSACYRIFLLSRMIILPHRLSLTFYSLSLPLSLSLSLSVLKRALTLLHSFTHSLTHSLSLFHPLFCPFSSYHSFSRLQ